MSESNKTFINSFLCLKCHISKRKPFKSKTCKTAHVLLVKLFTACHTDVLIELIIKRKEKKLKQFLKYWDNAFDNGIIIYTCLQLIFYS